MRKCLKTREDGCDPENERVCKRLKIKNAERGRLEEKAERSGEERCRD
jgi:hypothetical protein